MSRSGRIFFVLNAIYVKILLIPMEYRLSLKFRFGLLFLLELFYVDFSLT